MQRNISALRHTAGLPDDADFLSLLDQASSTLSKLPTGSVALYITNPAGLMSMSNFVPKPILQICSNIYKQTFSLVRQKYINHSY